jgi:hypothetical protein
MHRAGVREKEADFYHGSFAVRFTKWMTA